MCLKGEITDIFQALTIFPLWRKLSSQHGRSVISPEEEEAALRPITHLENCNMTLSTPYGFSISGLVLGGGWGLKSHRPPLKVLEPEMRGTTPFYPPRSAAAHEKQRNEGRRLSWGRSHYNRSPPPFLRSAHSPGLQTSVMLVVIFLWPQSLPSE